MSDVAELAAQLVEIESINPDMVAGGSGEGAVARFVAEWCERAGLETTLTELGPGRAERRRGRARLGRRPLADAERAHGHGRRRGHDGSVRASASKADGSTGAARTT